MNRGAGSVLKRAKIRADNGVESIDRAVAKVAHQKRRRRHRLAGAIVIPQGEFKGPADTRRLSSRPLRS